MSGGNPISAVTNAISSVLGTDGSGGGILGAVSSVVQGVGSAVSNAVQDIGSLGAQLDSSVRSAIPGGWATLGEAA